MVDQILASMPTYILVFARLGGMIGTNPLLNRRNVPGPLRAGLVLLLTLLIAPGLPLTPAVTDEFDFILKVLLEIFVGVACGYVFQIYYYMLFFAGDVMDMQFGMAMAKVFDPGTNIQMSVSGNFLNILFVLFVFATNSHLLLIRIFAASFDIIPAGTAAFSTHIAGFVMDLFIEAFSLAFRLALPFIAVEFVMELSMGILMKLIPQIHVFVINIQFKMLMAFLMLLTFGGALGSFLDRYMTDMFENLQKVFMAFSM